MHAHTVLRSWGCVEIELARAAHSPLVFHLYLTYNTFPEYIVHVSTLCAPLRIFPQPTSYPLIPLVSHTRGHSSNTIKFLSFPFLLSLLRAFSTRRSSGGTAVHTISADIHLLLFFSPLLSLGSSLSLGRHFHTRSTYLRYTANEGPRDRQCRCGQCKL